MRANPHYDRIFRERTARLDRELRNALNEIRQRLANQRGVSVLGISPDEARHQEEWTQRSQSLMETAASDLQGHLNWGTANIDLQLRTEIRQALQELAERLDIPVRLLILAIRSSALGEDSETASFAGRQDTSLFVMILDTLRVLSGRGINMFALRSELDRFQGELRRYPENGCVKTEFCVADTGIGIKPEDQALLFQAFTQVRSSTASRPEGTGLGLHLSKKLAELLGGRVTFHSEYGKGSEFTFTLEDRALAN